MDSRSVSIIVPVLNGESTIGDLLIALSHQRGIAFEHEIIIVDNGSTDQTTKIVSEFDVTLLHESKRGPSAARNRGLQSAAGEIVAFLDADTIPTSSWLREISSVFEDPDLIIAAGRTYSYKPSTPAEKFVARMGPIQPEYDLGRRVFPFMSSRNLAVRRKAALDIGGWAEDMPTAEDMDFCYRIRYTFNTEVHLQETAVVFHKDRTTDEELWKQTRTYGEGLADMYIRYPQTTSWSFRKTLRVVSALCKRVIQAGAVWITAKMGFSDIHQVEHYHYLLKWSWCYWKGFFSMVRSGERTKA